jgi:hypothetical protein
MPLKYQKRMNRENAFSETYFGCDLSDKNYFIDSFTMPTNPKFNKTITKSKQDKTKKFNDAQRDEQVDS